MGEVINVSVSKLIEQGMLEYGATTIEQRAIPDFRDGLKPVHRRILYAMYALGIFPNKGLKKSAAIVGETLAKYHPHSDTGVFKTLVNLVHERYPLVFGSGNWGDEYSASAASRYIDCRLTNLAMSLFEYIPVAKYVDNYSGEFKEPLVLPSKIPLLLMNGTSGIAVGVSVEIPPHNLKELVEALVYLIKSPNTSTADLIKFIKGPDYELGGVLVSSEAELLKVYETGKGSLTFRCQYRFVELKGKKILEVFNYCPRFDQDGFIHKCEALVEKDLLDYVNNDSAEGIFKLSIGFSNASIIEEKVLPLLYQTMSYRFYVTERLDEDEVTFRNTNLRALMSDWLDYQKSIRADYYNYILNNLRIDLIKKSTRLLATKYIDKVAQALKMKNALEYLMQELKISKERARYILTLQVGSLMKVSTHEQTKEIDKVQVEVQSYKDRLTHLDREVIKDLRALGVFFDTRRTLVREEPPELEATDNLWIISTNKGIKRVADYRKVRAVDMACVVSKGFYTVDEGGTVLKWKALDEIKPYPNTFQCISGDYEYLCVLDLEGNVAVLDLFKIKRKEFVALITEGKLISAVGFNREDILLFSDAKRKSVEIRTINKDITLCRTSTKGFTLNQLKAASRVEVVSPNDLILRNDKRPMTTSSIVINDGEQQILVINDENEQVSITNIVEKSAKWCIVGEYNLCEGRVMSRQEILDSFKLEPYSPEVKKLR